MQKCPKCGKEMKVGGYVGGDLNRPAYNCGNCKLDCWVPAKPKSKPPEKPKVKKPSSKKKTRRTY